MKTRVVVWIQNDSKCVCCLPLWSHSWLGAEARCHCPASWRSIVPNIASQEKIKIQSTVSTEYISFLHHHKVDKSLSQAVVCQEPSVLFYSSFSCCSLWNEVTIYSSDLRSGSCALPSLMMEYLHKLFGILLPGSSVSSLPFIYLFIHLFIYLVNYLFVSVYTHGTLFYALGYNPVLLYFIVQKCFSFGHWELFPLVLCPVAHYHQRGFFWQGSSEHFLIFWHYDSLQSDLIYFLP